MNALVIKCGGSTIDKLPTSFFTDLVELRNKGFHPIIVHGGGPNISSLLSSLNVETLFVNGLRKTTEPVLEVVEMVLSGSLNKHIVRKILKAGGKSMGLSGVDGRLLEAEPVANTNELGLVGEIIQVNIELLSMLLLQDYIPVISPVAVDKAGQHYNINADLAAAAIANELYAPLCMVSDVDGVLVNEKVIPAISENEIARLIEEKQITGGMIPKVQAAVISLHAGVKKVSILNGETPGALQTFVATEGTVGTTFYIEEVTSNHA
ncbi:Acetylglutamate kinase [Bacillus sp. THAF10]|uniref:acetylglutamate kinase n=1 Tax=Bacillus sp. THAF10 TaxID=2587848 RepID=UPI001267C14F|nr:acetylglutamate kinase [Bacillus sp. THAF10]QFT89161.1 Acetylglutamate kinase [Bacillus sp. THAF10]